jgi:retron-type reverse transcriptase
MDRVVQEAIRMSLEAIYEPWFELRTRAFGFRPRKGVQDAIGALTNRYFTTGLHMAIEGDISAAYDKVNTKKSLYRS